MEYDFHGLCADQLEKLNKKLESLNKSFMKEYQLALNVINNPIEQEKRSETMIAIEDCLHDTVTKCASLYGLTMKKLTNEIGQHLK